MDASTQAVMRGMAATPGGLPGVHDREGPGLVRGMVAGSGRVSGARCGRLRPILGGGVGVVRGRCGQSGGGAGSEMVARAAGRAASAVVMARCAATGLRPGVTVEAAHGAAVAAVAT